MTVAVIAREVVAEVARTAAEAGIVAADAVHEIVAHVAAVAAATTADTAGKPPTFSNERAVGVSLRLFLFSYFEILLLCNL